MDGTKPGGKFPALGGSVVRKTLALLFVAVVMVALASTAALAQVASPEPETPADKAHAKEAEEALKKKEAALLDCDDIATQRGAQALFKISSQDRFDLDKDGDGVACEAEAGETAEDGTKVGAKTGRDLDCMDFASQKAAQTSLRDDPSDPQKLDPENNGVACDIRPTSYEDAAADLEPVTEARSAADLDCEDFEYREEAMMVWFRDQSDPNGLAKGEGRDKPQRELDKGERKLAPDPAVCAELPTLPSSGEALTAAPAGPQEASLAPAALITEWPRGGGIGLLLDLGALLLVSSGVLALLAVRRLRPSRSA